MAGAALNGKWVFDHSEGMDEVIKAANVPADKVPKDGNTTIEIQVTGDTVAITTNHVASGKSKTNTLSIGQSHEAEELSKFAGQTISATPSWDGSKLVIKGDGGKGTVTREVAGGQLVTTIQLGGVTGKRFFNKA